MEKKFIGERKKTKEWKKNGESKRLHEGGEKKGVRG
jgi:hypothetical protein